MNYDFQKNWHIIRPLLKTKKMKNAIKKGIKWWLKNCGERYEREYDEKLFPYEYGLGDGNYYFQYEYNVLTPRLVKEGILKDEEPDMEDYETYEEYDKAYTEFQQNYSDYEARRSKIRAPYVKEFRENSYETYCIYRACHWWNPTFGLTLANLVMPEVGWEVLQSDIHTTILSPDNSLVFDILLYDPKDKTFGGKKAIHDVYNRIDWHEHNKISEKIMELRGLRYYSDEKYKNYSKEKIKNIISRLELIKEYRYYVPPYRVGERHTIVFEKEV